MCEATAMQPAAAHLQVGEVGVVVAGEDDHAVDRLLLWRVGLLDGDDPVDLGELREQVRPHVHRGAAGDVVDDHRGPARRAGDLGEVRQDPAPVRLVVVGRHREDRVRPGGDHALGQLDRVARVVRARAGDDRALSPGLARDQLDEPGLLVVGQRRGLAGGAGDDQAVGPVGEQVLRHRHGRVVVDAAVRLERRDHGREQSFVRAHGRQCATRGGRQPASGSPLVSGGGA